MNIEKEYYFIIIILIYKSYGAFIASSNIEQCINTGDPYDLDCDTKLVVTLTLENGQNRTESLEAIITSVEDEEGNINQLERSIKITLAKSEPLILYPVSYIQTTNAKPEEEIIYKAFLFNSCNAGYYA